MRWFSIQQEVIQNQSLLEKSDFLEFYKNQLSNAASNSSNVEKIISQVRKFGDAALIELSNKFDAANFVHSSDFLVNDLEMQNAEEILSSEVKIALEIAFKRISEYHLRQMPQDFNYRDDSGVLLGNEWRAIQSVGIYVPGGSASYPSSVLMSAVPAMTAGVSEILVSAPSKSGLINPATLFAAKICGIKKIYKIGGAQAIAAMAYGTESVSKVHKICGPGNSFVATAKKIVFGEVGIDMIAGPTDLTIIADSTVNPVWAAIDALSQLEHGADSRIFLITDSQEFAEHFVAEIKKIAPTLPRYEIIAKSLENSAILKVSNLSDAPIIVDLIAPEHLQIMAKNANHLAKNINNAGAIFIGQYTPEAIGDYIAGPSHTLPTSATSKFASGLSVYDFLKRISVISCDSDSFQKIAKSASILADCEGLQAHKLSIDIRSKS